MAQFEITREFIETIEKAVEANDRDFILSEIKDLHAVDINSILEELETDEAKYIFDILEVDVQAEIISELDPDIRVRFLKNFTAENVASFLEYAESDDAADILNEQEVEFRDEVLDNIEDQEVAANILELVHYEESSAGSLMAKEFVKANVRWSVVQCIEEIRRQALKVDKLYSIYVVDDKNKLMGRVSLKKILLSSDEVRIGDIYEEDVHYIEAYESTEKVTQIMSKYDLDALPVVNLQQKLLGRITIDDVIDVITEQAEAERQMMTGISNSRSGLETFVGSVTSRLPWLLIGMIGGLLGANLIGFFEADLIAVPAMAFFIPLITATGGNVGIQSSSVVVQGLANKSAFEDSWVTKAFKSFLVALANGLVISLIVFAFNFFFAPDLHLAVVISLALYSVVVLASLTGTLTPLILDKFGINPAMASGPFITTSNDILGITVYFLVARMLL